MAPEEAARFDVSSKNCPGKKKEKPEKNEKRKRAVYQHHLLVTVAVVRTVTVVVGLLHGLVDVTGGAVIVL